MAFPSVSNVVLIIIGTAMWAVGSILQVKEAKIAETLANVCKFSQGIFQDIIAVLYALLLIASSSMFFTSSYRMVKDLYFGIAVSSPYNVATLTLTAGTGFWALGSLLATKHNQLAMILTNCPGEGNEMGVWSQRLSNIFTLLVIIGVLFFIVGILSLFGY